MEESIDFLFNTNRLQRKKTKILSKSAAKLTRKHKLSPVFLLVSVVVVKLLKPNTSY